jgi:hypothetical protein
MANARLRYNTQKFKEITFKTMLNIVKDTSAKEEIGRYLVRTIVAAGRKGEPYNSTKSFPELEPSTIERKEEIRKISSPKARNFKTGKSNLVLTGQLWKSLVYKYNYKMVEVYFDNTRRKPYIDPDTLRPEIPDPDAQTNKDLANKLDEGIDSKSGKKRFRAFEPKIVAADVLINRRILAIFKANVRRLLAIEFKD